MCNAGWLFALCYIEPKAYNLCVCCCATLLGVHYIIIGLRQSEMENELLDEVDNLSNELGKSVGEELSLASTFNISVLNALWAILVGEKLPLGNPKILKLVNGINRHVKKTSGMTRWVSMLPNPRLLLLCKNRVGLHLLEEIFREIGGMVEDQIKSHKSTHNPDNVRDMMDLFINEIEKTTDKTSSFYGKPGYYAMINDYIDLFVAGMETTSTSLLWIILHLLHHPEVKHQVHKELDKVFGF